MKARWVTFFFILILASAGGLRASPANDPRIIIGGGSGSVSVTGSFTIVSPTGTSPSSLAGGSPCIVNGIPDDTCTLLNVSGFDFSTLTFTVSGNTNTQGGFSCDPGTFFQNCTFNAADTEVTFSGGPGIRAGFDFSLTFEGWSPGTSFQGTGVAPEPGTLALFGGGLLVLGSALRKLGRRESNSAGT